MDLFDLPIVPPSGPRRKLTPAEHAAAAVCLVAFPLIDVMLLTVTELSKRPGLAVIGMPAMFAAAAALVCVALRVSAGRTLISVLGCAFWCFLGGIALVAIDILIFPF